METSVRNAQQARSAARRRTATTKERREKEFHEAVERVYRKYGNDLSAFLRNVQRERELVKRG
jgi:hypothetical protein